MTSSPDRSSVISAPSFLTAGKMLLIPLNPLLSPAINLTNSAFYCDMSFTQ